MKLGRRETIKRTLKALRATAGLSQLDVAEHIGIPEKRYWRIENGYEQPTDAEQARLARALKVEISDLGFTPSSQSKGAAA